MCTLQVEPLDQGPLHPLMPGANFIAVRENRPRTRHQHMHRLRVRRRLPLVKQARVDKVLNSMPKGLKRPALLGRGSAARLCRFRRRLSGEMLEGAQGQRQGDRRR